MPTIHSKCTDKIRDICGVLQPFNLSATITQAPGSNRVTLHINQGAHAVKERTFVSLFYLYDYLLILEEITQILTKSLTFL